MQSAKTSRTTPPRPCHRRVDLHRRHALRAQRAARRFRRLAGGARKLISSMIWTPRKRPRRRRDLHRQDIPGHNVFGPVMKDEHLLVERRSRSSSADPLVLIAAEIARSASRGQEADQDRDGAAAADLFRSTRRSRRSSFLGPKRTIARGDVETGARQFRAHRSKARSKSAGRSIFISRSQAAIAYPGEHGQMTVHSSTQHPSEVQIDRRRGDRRAVQPRDRSSASAWAAASAERKPRPPSPRRWRRWSRAQTRRPARIVYNKDDDMRFTGKRHPFKSWYKVGFSSDGRITALSIDHYSNGGCSIDLRWRCWSGRCCTPTTPISSRTSAITGQVCKTNLPSNTAFRGFGGPQGVAKIENIIEEIAHASSSIDAHRTVRRRAICYGDRRDDATSTPYGQIIQNNTLPRAFRAAAGDDATTTTRRPRDRCSSTQHRRRTCTGMSHHAR